MYKYFRPRIRTRHPSHEVLRPKYKNLPLFPFKSIIRLGSFTSLKDTITRGGNRIELNTIEAINNSANKLLMKDCFSKHNIKTADWWTYIATDLDEGFVKQDGSSDNSLVNLGDLPFPIISKHIKGSRGLGNKKHDSKEELQAWLNSKDNLDKYIFEKYYNYSREYRLHVSEDGCFYTCRKMIKSDTPPNKRWFRNDQNSVWVVEDNPSFDKPKNWEDIVTESVKALKSVGLDFGAVDLRIQSATNKKGEIRKNLEFIVVEINSAPSFGEITSKKYLEELPKILLKKQKQLNNE